MAKYSIPESADPARRSDGRFVPGHTRGRPKGRRNTRTIIEERLALSAQTREDLITYHGAPAEMVPEDASPLELLLIFTMFRALRGDEGCRRDILDRVEAKQARTEITGPGGGPLQFRSPVGASGVGPDAAAEYYAQRDALPEDAGDE